ncbi:hypothetical protein BJ878DRAFT_480799 [Calycina marina]|uniref:Uncharacterized protein n=1 Tax=Calycina marina TaxID=1763456 RepID=A0A9P7Z276_9HELO|nr:hypothetical protein BJ878DRAFT_480799 [Calycina marina]
MSTEPEPGTYTLRDGRTFPVNTCLKDISDCEHAALTEAADILRAITGQTGSKLPVYLGLAPRRCAIPAPITAFLSTSCGASWSKKSWLATRMACPSVGRDGDNDSHKISSTPKSPPQDVVDAELCARRIAEQLHHPDTHGLSLSKLEKQLRSDNWKDIVEKLFRDFDAENNLDARDAILDLKEGPDALMSALVGLVQENVKMERRRREKYSRLILRLNKSPNRLLATPRCTIHSSNQETFIQSLRIYA